MIIHRWNDISEHQLFFARDYIDRGMKKWQGFFLSDHTSKLEHHKAIRKEQDLGLQDNNIKSKKLFTAWHQSNGVHLQMNSVYLADNAIESYSGVVVEYFDDMIFLKEFKSKKVQYLWFDDIRNVSTASRPSAITHNF